MRILFVWVVVLVLLAGGRVRAEEVQLVSLRDPMDDTSLAFPRDVSTVLFTRNIKHLPAAGEKEVNPVDLMRMIDTDHASFFELGIAQDLTFHLSLNALQRVRHITITGWNLQGTTVDVKFTAEPISTDEPGWKPLVEGARLDSPCTAIRFTPTTMMQAIITFHSPPSDGGKPPRVCDVAMISQQDLREYRIERRPEARARTTVTPPLDLTANSMPFERQPNLGAMTTGSHVVYMSRGANMDQAYFVNDDDTKTWCDFSTSERDSVVILDMTESRRVRKACLIHSRARGEVAAYVVNHLPWLGDEEDKDKVQADANGNGHANGSGTAVARSRKKGKTPPPMVSVPSSWFDELHKLGSGRTDEVEFTQMEAPVIECRYFIVRFLRSTPPQTARIPVWLRPTAWWFAGVGQSDVMPVENPGGGGSDPFRLFDVNVFGDYPPEDWELGAEPEPLTVTAPSLNVPTSTPKDPELLTPTSPP